MPKKISHDPHAKVEPGLHYWLEHVVHWHLLLVVFILLVVIASPLVK